METYGLHGRVRTCFLKQKFSLMGFQVIAINCDNASNNDTMAEGLEAQSLAQGFEFDAQENQLRCMPHTVHLAAMEVN